MARWADDRVASRLSGSAGVGQFVATRHTDLDAPRRIRRQDTIAVILDAQQDPVTLPHQREMHYARLGVTLDVGQRLDASAEQRLIDLFAYGLDIGRNLAGELPACAGGDLLRRADERAAQALVGVAARAQVGDSGA